ncbi:Y-family DNA polymerase [Frigidibacter sp. MR17.24]|uniref:Y-family DNA polymerase n=1 Tax=Frigidibacter sp. MR17.24 TaxID=3127345 RepID=UPI0030131B5F
MSGGRSRRIVSIWFPRLASDRVLRRWPAEPGPFALIARTGNTDRLHCLTAGAEAAGLARGMAAADARALCPGLVTRPAAPEAEARFLAMLARWATRWCPWVGLEAPDGLVLDLTGAAHLHGGEAATLDRLGASLARGGITARLGLADSRGAAWALARHGSGDGNGGGNGGGRARPGETRAALAPLPVEALRLDPETAAGLRRMGLETIGHLLEQPRAPLARRFGPGLVTRLDQALGTRGEEISPLPEPPRDAVRMTLPEPIGLKDDLRGLTARLLGRLCATLAAREVGARSLRLTLRRVDQSDLQVELRLASPMVEPARILPLFDRGIEDLDAGFGIDQLRLQATLVEPMPPRQLTQSGLTRRGLTQSGSAAPPARSAALDDLVTRIGNRIGLENVQRLLPADSHIPERAFLRAPFAWSEPATGWFAPRIRPLSLFPPEPVETPGPGPHPPRRFRWRRMRLTTLRATGPERIAPEWWLDDPGWRRGLRDYWRIETREGRRLWLYFTPQDPGWFAQGEFA